MSSASSGCHDRALNLLAVRPHFRRELEQKLERKGFDRVEVEEVCDKLTAHGLLDDAATARGMLEGPLRRKGYGPQRLRAELERRGVAKEIVTDLLAGIGPEEEAAAARRLARRWLGGRTFDRARLARHLHAKGYGQATILDLLEELGGAGEMSDRR